MHVLLRKGMGLAGRIPLIERIQPNSGVEKRNRLVKECKKILEEWYFSRKDFEKFIDNMGILMEPAWRVTGTAIFPVKALDDDGEEISLVFRKSDLRGNKSYSISASVMRGYGNPFGNFTEEVWYEKQDTANHSRLVILPKYSVSIPFVELPNVNQEHNVVYNSFLRNSPMVASLDPNTGRYCRVIEDDAVQLMCSETFEVVVSKNRVDFPPR